MGRRNRQSFGTMRGHARYVPPINKSIMCISREGINKWHGIFGILVEISNHNFVFHLIFSPPSLLPIG
jgi:hypothetical protein